MCRRFSVEYILRGAVAFAFIYPPLSAITDPFAWVGYFPSFLLSLPIDKLILLHSFGVFELAIALWILFGKRIMIPSIIAALTLTTIILFNFSQIDLLFRDVSIAFAAIALAFLSRNKQRDLPAQQPTTNLNE